ncbi:MAG: triose-phosphate isomerase [Thermoplasmata archaeon]|nr:triose-phosphate isomerase [Thermoplasmata archaeon]
MMGVAIVNLKTYPGGFGSRGVELAKELESAAAGHDVTVALAVQAVDVRLFSEAVSLPVFAQHIDSATAGGNTGAVLPEALAEAGASGTLINHSERRLALAEIEAAVRRARECGLHTVVCSNNEATSAAAAIAGPDYVAMEPPELIGGNVSVTNASPDVISRTVALVRRTAPAVGVLCGAGVKSRADVARAIELGAEGILVASGIVLAADPAAAMADMLSGFER